MVEAVSELKEGMVNRSAANLTALSELGGQVQHLTRELFRMDQHARRLENLEKELTETRAALSGLRSDFEATTEYRMHQAEQRLTDAERRLAGAHITNDGASQRERLAALEKGAEEMRKMIGNCIMEDAGIRTYAEDQLKVLADTMEKRSELINQRLELINQRLDATTGQPKPAGDASRVMVGADVTLSYVATAVDSLGRAVTAQRPTKDLAIERCLDQLNKHEADAKLWVGLPKDWQAGPPMATGSGGRRCGYAKSPEGCFVAVWMNEGDKAPYYHGSFNTAAEAYNSAMRGR